MTFRSPDTSTADSCNSDACLACVLSARAEIGPDSCTTRETQLRCDIERLSAVPRIVRLAVALIQRHYAENVSLRQLARAVACSPWHLSKVFHASTGLTLTQYRTQVRLARALVRLRDGEQSLAMLAVDLGFAHHSHFTAAFVRMMGAQPSAVRFQTRNVHKISTAGGARSDYG